MRMTAVVDLLRRHLLWVGAIAGLLIGAMIGLFLPIRAATAPAAGAEDWVFPGKDAAVRMPEASYQRLRGTTIFGASREQSSQNKRVAWRLLAIETRPQLRAAVQSPAGKAPLWIRVGESLPDGTRLVAIDRDRVWSDAPDGCRRVRHLYARPDHDPDACINGVKSSVSTPGAPAGNDPRRASAAPRQAGLPPAPTPAREPIPVAAPMPSAPAAAPSRPSAPVPTAPASPPSRPSAPVPSEPTMQGNRST